jgi:tRNA-2-methylthio-N6-dimethylallyladenosine synthase
MNQSDAERIRAVLEGMGYARTENEEEANLLGIVACSVRQKAIDKVYARIDKWNQWKNEKHLLTFVSGCILPADREKFLERFDLLFTINELPHLPDMIRQYGVVTPAAMHAMDEEQSASEDAVAEDAVRPAGSATPEAVALNQDGGDGNGVADRAEGSGVVPSSSKNDEAKGYWKITPQYSSSFEAYVPIQNGCDKFCTFCAVPFTRGREVSRPSGEILQEVRSLVQNGYKSITLLGQNVNSYGWDRRSDEISFAELLRRVGEIGRETGQEFWVYFTSPHPRDMSEDVIQAIADYPVLAKQVHLPIQSGNDKVLIRMNRNYRLSQYRRVVENIRRLIPEATLFTDIIVGFSGETEEQFEDTRQAMREFQYNMAYIAMYSPRPGAASSRWEDDVPHQEKKRRLHELTSELKEMSYRYNRSLIGKHYRLLVEKQDRKEGYLSGKTEGRLIVRFPSTDESLIGSFVEVRITDAAELSLEGELVESAARRHSEEAVAVS